MRELFFLIILVLGTTIGFMGCGEDCDDEADTAVESPAADAAAEEVSDAGISEEEADAEAEAEPEEAESRVSSW